MVFKSIKSRIRAVIARAARSDQMEARIAALEHAVAELSPETLPRSRALDAAIAPFLARNDLAGLDVTISKNDLMYQYVLREQGNKNAAHLWYLESGLQMNDLVDAIARESGRPLAELDRILDSRAVTVV